MYRHENECVLHDQNRVFMCMNVSVCLHVLNKALQIYYSEVFNEAYHSIPHYYQLSSMHITTPACIYSASIVRGLIIIDITFTEFHCDSQLFMLWQRRAMYQQC